MEFFRRAELRGPRLGILPGTFNPPTEAHMALARAASAQVDEVLFVLPRLFPHKPYTGASFEERIAMLQDAAEDCDAWSIGASEGGLFAEIAGECRDAYGPAERLSFLCGSDAARRIVEWDYGVPGAIERILQGFDLLVAVRGAEYAPPLHLSHVVRRLEVGDDYHEVSATEVRRRIAAGEPWEHLVPVAVQNRARKIYESRPPTPATG